MTFRRTIGPRATVVIVISILVLAIPLMVMVGSQNRAASIWPTIVRGSIMDSEGNKIEGANVTVEMVNETSGLVTKTLYVDSTPASGFYLVTFSGGEWGVGDTIRVTARFGVLQDQNTTIATEFGIQYVNVTLTSVIPEFGSLLGISTSMISIGLVAATIVAFRRKRQE